MCISKNDQEILRELANKYMEIATLPIQKEKMELWKALNRCDMKRPMVVMDQLPWNELNTEQELNCKAADPFWRGIEQQIRRTIYKWNNFSVDMVIEPYITIPSAITTTGYGISIKENVLTINEEETASSHCYVNQIKQPEDIEKIKDINVVYDSEETNRRLEEARFIFNGIAPVQASHGIKFHLGLWDRLSQLMGIETIYYDIVDRPEFIHALMDRITKATLHGIEMANNLGLHNDIENTCHCSYTYTDELLPDFGKGKGSISKNSWAYGMAQLFTSASPQVTEEFEIPYISKLSEQYGMLYYGCCEKLDDRLEIIKRIPNVKKISCSPWSKSELFAEKIGKKQVMSYKPNPAYLSGESMDEDSIKRDLTKVCRLAKSNDINLEIIQKDISTINFSPQRLARWAQIAMSIVES